MITGAHSRARRAVDGTDMKRERPMVIGFVAGAEKERARFSKPPPSATRPRLRRRNLRIGHAEYRQGPQRSRGPRPSCDLARFLIEQNRAHVRVFHVDVKGRFHLDGQAAFDRRTRLQGLEPAPDVWKAAQVVAVALGPARPTDASDVGDRIIAGKKFAVL